MRAEHPTTLHELNQSCRSYAIRLCGLFAVAGQLAAVCFSFLMITERDALAYTDPGSGALIWQMLVACMFGGMFYFRKLVDIVRCWRKREGDAAQKDNKAGR